VSYATELFSSATKTLLGPAFPEKAATHLCQMKTLRESKSEAQSAGFSEGPLTLLSVRGQILKPPETSPTTTRG